MSRVQGPPNGYVEINKMQRHIDALERTLNTLNLRDVKTTGLSSAQIDFAVFGGQQPYDGAQVRDSVNHLLLVRQSGSWYKATMTVIP